MKSPVSRMAALSILSVILLSAAILKLGDIDDLARSMVAARLSPPSSSLPLAGLLIATELFLGGALVFPRLRQYAIRGTIVLSGAFLGYALWRSGAGISVPCNCFGALLTLAPWQSAALASSMGILAGALLTGKATS
jgi:hypothetical protein